MDGAILKQEKIVIYLFVLLLEGYLTLSIEILTIRQLIPFVGNSVIATSLIIGFFLLALAFGYQRGGTYRDNYHAILTRNFTVSFYLLGVGLAYFFVALFFDFFGNRLSIHQFIVLALYLFIITVPLIYLLGQTVPLVMGMMHNVSHTASISGFVLNISTIGSFLGSIFTSLVLLNFFGVAATIVFNLFCLCILIFMFSNLSEIRFVIISASMAVMYIFNIGFENQYFVATNAYGNYRIETRKISPGSNKTGKFLFINESSASLITDEQKTFNYIEFIKKLLFIDLQLENKNIVILGAGGFTLTAEDDLINDLNNTYTYVDIDKNIKKIVLDNKYLAKINGTFIAQDAREFIRGHLNKFDVVVSDAYTNQKSIPFHLLTQEYFTNIYNSLVDDGIAVFNFIGSPVFKDEYIRSINNTIHRVFAYCTVSPINLDAKTSNIIYACHKSNTKYYVYTDNLNSAPLDMANVGQK